VLLIGAGLVGCEFANDLISAGHQVTIVDPAPWPLGRLLPEQVGNQLAQALRDIGITLHLGASISEVSDGKAVLKDGTVIAYDHALSAIGLIPRIGLAKEAGLTVDKGIVVDRSLRTSDPFIYAIGDCAQTPAGLLPFVMPLMTEAKILADILVGGDTVLRFPAMPVVVKTPCLPLAVCPPGPSAEGSWGIEGEGRDLKALFVGTDGKPLGFALSGNRATERQALAKTMPDVLG
jgi:rubredoxin-NAD+ reductase